MKKKYKIILITSIIVLFVGTLAWVIYEHMETVKAEKDLEKAALSFTESITNAFAESTPLEGGPVYEMILRIWDDVEVFKKNNDLVIHIFTDGETKTEDAQQFFETSALMMTLGNKLFKSTGYERVFIYFRPRYINTIQVGLAYELNVDFELVDILKNVTDEELEKAIDDYFDQEH